MHVVCPHCDAVNRVPEARLGEHPVCGACRAPLFGAKPVALDAARFRHHLAKSELPLLVDFWASWCGAMAPQFEAAAATLEPRLRLAKVSTEEAPEIARELGITGIPLLVLFQGGRELARQAGAMPAGRIAAWAAAALSRP
jgi:thioredoxin 2